MEIRSDGWGALAEMIRFSTGPGADAYVNSIVSKQSTGASSSTELGFDLNTGVSGVQSRVLTLLGSGNVGIGTSTPAYKLQIQQGEIGITNLDPSFTAVLGVIGAFNNSANTGGLVFKTSSSGVISEKMRLDSDGNLLVGKTSADFLTAGIELRTSGQLNVSVNADNFNFYNPSASVYRFFVSAAGQVYATSTSISAISDVTLKENIKPLETGLKEVMKLQPRRFDWKNGDGKNIAGFIAQEVEEILPDLVSDYKYNDNETKKSLKMGDMIPTLVKSIQELKAEIELLKNK